MGWPQPACVRGYAAAAQIMRFAPPTQLLAYRRVFIVATHAALIPLAYFAAFAVRFDFAIPATYVDRYAGTVAYLLVLRLALLHGFGLFRGYWRHAGIRDLVDLVAAVTLGSALFAAGLMMLDAPRVPRSVLLLDWLVTIFLAGGVRFAARVSREGQRRIAQPNGTRTLIIGGGDAAEQLLRQVLHDPASSLHVVGIVDDDRAKHGRSVHGVPILGATAALPAFIAEHRVTQLVIAIASASADVMRRVVARCMETGVPYKIIPPLQELLTGHLQIAQFRDVQIEDLLGRQPVQLDLEYVARDLAGRTVLVTGGAGSIGSELARQIGRFRPARIVLLERAESPLYFTHLEIARAHPQVDVVPVMANVTNGDRLKEIFAAYRPDYVFHAAAYKHVPMLEANPTEGLWNNVVGTWRVATCAVEHGVGKFVLISTDKAVNPTSVLGATKRIAERIILELPALAASRTDFRVVRFGNVLGSDGSVVPLFKRQLAAGGPLTVTHPHVQRFFMTIPEAVQLVLLAAALPEAASRIAILDMGEPVRILDLAEQLTRLSGLVPHRDVQIVFTGLRPGEKLDEELIGKGELAVSTSVEKIRVVQRNGATAPAVEEGLRWLMRAIAVGDQDGITRAIGRLVPEYGPWGKAAKPREPAATGGGGTARPHSLVERALAVSLPAPSAGLRPV